jgi:hypothetical protein
LQFWFCLQPSEVSACDFAEQMGFNGGWLVERSMQYWPDGQPLIVASGLHVHTSVVELLACLQM